MNLEIAFKTQNVRSFNLSETGLISMKTKIKAAMLEGDNILCLTNTQIGRNRRIIENEFLLGGATQPMKSLPIQAQAMQGEL